MAKFSVEQAAAVAAIQQVINEWGHELDENNGLSIVEADILSEDCRYNVGGVWREGRAAVGQFYREREQRLAAESGVPVMRHVMSNYRVSFVAQDRAEVGFLLVYFAATGTPHFTSYCDPLAVADVRMECRRDKADEWRIAMFDSGQIFRRG